MIVLDPGCGGVLLLLFLLFVVVGMGGGDGVDMCGCGVGMSNKIYELKKSPKHFLDVI